MNKEQIAVKMILDRWNASIKNLDVVLAALNDDDLMREVAPGKNRGYYLLGHLIAVHDDMIKLMGLGEKLYPELHEPFIKNADKVMVDEFKVSDLRLNLNRQNEWMKQQFDAFTNDDWYDKHTAVSQEEFVAEPHRNKLNIVLTRTTHLQYHLGQLKLITKHDN